MKRKLVSFVLAAALLLPAALTGCNGGGDGAVTTAPESETTAADENALIDIVKDGTALYTIIRDDTVSEAIAAKVAEVRDVITEVTGVEIPYEDGFVKYGEEPDPDSRQIIIGMSDFVTETDFLADCGMLDYKIKTVNNRIVAVGWSDKTTTLAADELVKLVRQYGKDGSLSLPAPDAAFTVPVVSHEHKTDDSFVLTYFFGPSPDEFEANPDAMRLVAEAGFTRLNIDESNTHFQKCPDEQIFAAIESAAEYGLEVCMFLTERIQAKYLLDIEAPMPSQEEIDAAVAEIIDVYGGYENIVQWHLRDEPPEELYPVIAMIVDAFHRLDPTRPVTINMLPGHSMDYYEYLDKFYGTVDADCVSFDRYRFNGDPPSLGEDSTYFDSMWTIKYYSKLYCVPAYMIVLLTKHYGYSYLCEEQLRWEANVCLAYGYNEVSYFTYHHWEEGGMIDEEGKPTDQYYYVQNLSRDVVPVGRQLATTELEMVFNLDTGSFKGGVVDYFPYGDLGEVGGENAVIGFFEDDSIYIVNNNYNTGVQPNVLTLNDTAGALEWFDPSDETWKDAAENPEFTVTSDGYTLALPSGDGVLIRAVK